MTIQFSGMQTDVLERNNVQVSGTGRFASHRSWRCVNDGNTKTRYSAKQAADREKMQQILINLLTNAVKFTPAGGMVTLGAVAARLDGHVGVSVTDSGIGIPATKLASVFEPFVQVDVNETRRKADSGLGLAISRDLARGMGGDLLAQSEEGRGSTFTLLLPRVASP